MKFYWQDQGWVILLRGFFLLSSLLVAFAIWTDLPYHNGIYVPYFVYALIAILCFGIGRKISWIQFVIGLVFLFPAFTHPNY